MNLRRLAELPSRALGARAVKRLCSSTQGSVMLIKGGRWRRGAFEPRDPGDVWEEEAEENKIFPLCFSEKDVFIADPKLPLLSFSLS